MAEGCERSGCDVTICVKEDGKHMKVSVIRRDWCDGVVMEKRKTKLVEE
jgi:hypothetical protein